MEAQQCYNAVLLHIAGPFHLISPPPMDAVSNILTHRKKIKVPTQISPQKFVNFPLTPQKTRRDQRMPTDLLTTQKRLWGHSSEKPIHGPGGGWWNIHAHTFSE